MNDTAQKLERLASRLATFSDTFAVRAHLAKEDAKDAWSSLEPLLHKQRLRAEKLATELTALKDETELQTYLGLKELADKVDLVTTQLERLTQSGKSELKTGVDMARLKADLAAMDADDFIRDKRYEVERALAHSKVELKTDLNKVFKRLTHRLESITN